MLAERLHEDYIDPAQLSYILIPIFFPSANLRAFNREIKMDKDRIAGSAKQAAGAVKEGVGKVTGDQKLQTEGAMQKTAGKAQNAFGGAKDAVREAIKK